MYNSYFNPYQQFGQPQLTQNQLSVHPQQIVRVNGENGARAFQMAPNSSALLLDESNPIVWLSQSDGAGYKTVTPYRIEPYIQNHNRTINLYQIVLQDWRAF